MWYLGAVERSEPEYALQMLTRQQSREILRRTLGNNHPYIRKVTLSTTLTQEAQKGEVKLPPQYKEYAKVFNKPTKGQLPPRCPFDHGIDLKDTFIPKVAKSYPMNPKEMEACKEFINKNLKSGKIRKSQSPQASPFFFIQNKDGGL